MANELNIQVLDDGPRNYIIKVQGKVDTSDIANTVIADIATVMAMDPTSNLKPATFQVREIQFSIEDLLAVNLLWDATTPVKIEGLTGRGKMDFHRFGNLRNNAGAGVTGKILLATQGWVAAAVLDFSLIIHLVKTSSI
jgi:hypothetical protein